MNVKKILRSLACGLFLLFVLGGCGPQATTDDPQEETTVAIAPAPSLEEAGIMEDTSVYSQDDPDSIVYFYVTVRRGDEGSDTDHSFTEVKDAVRFIDDSHVDNDVYARALVQVGDETGPLPDMLGYGLTKTNARIRIRGNSSTVKPQKSYKLDLDDEAGLWRGQSNIALNKSAFDVTRIRNKLYFDMLKEVEDVPSLRTSSSGSLLRMRPQARQNFKTMAFTPRRKFPRKSIWPITDWIGKDISTRPLPLTLSLRMP